MFSLVRENIKIAFDSIKTQLLRTILTVLIIAIGITALVGILSAVNAFENTINDDFASMGTNTFNIQRYDFTVRTRGRNEDFKINPAIDYRETLEFEKNYLYPNTKVSISFTGTGTAEINYNKVKTDPEVGVYGINENFIGNSGLKLEQGRDFTSAEIKNNANSCIIGSDLVEKLFKNIDPLDKVISVRGNRFKIIGVLEGKGSTFGNNQDLRILIPLQRARTIYNLPNINYNISVKVDDKEMMEGAQDEAIITFRKIRKLQPKEKNNFGIERSDSLLNEINNITGYLDMAAWIISIITILGSSIALMNIMLVSVTERTREIGVRKALGAKKNTIAFQFFSETIIIGQLGGIIGIILGILIGYIVATSAEFHFTIPWMAMFWAAFISFIIAIISGGYPAMKAAKQDPIESLRYE